VLTINVCDENPCSYNSGGDDNNMQRDLRVHQESESSIISSDDIRKSSAIFLLSLKEKYKLTQVALQGVIEGVTGLVQCYLSSLHNKVDSNLLQNGVFSPAIIQGIGYLLSDDRQYGSPFSGLETHHQQLKFYYNNFDFVVCLCEVKLCLLWFMYAV